MNKSFKLELVFSAIFVVILFAFSIFAYYLGGQDTTSVGTSLYTYGGNLYLVLSIVAFILLFLQIVFEKNNGIRTAFSILFTIESIFVVLSFLYLLGLLFLVPCDSGKRCSTSPGDDILIYMQIGTIISFGITSVLKLINMGIREKK